MVIGVTTGTPYQLAWDFENQVCYMTVNGELFSCGADIIVNDVEGNKVKDFDMEWYVTKKVNGIDTKKLIQFNSTICKFYLTYGTLIMVKLEYSCF